MPPAPTPAAGYSCVNKQCVAGSGTLSKTDCASICVEQLYVCVDNACVASKTDKGLPQATCKQNCGRSTTSAGVALHLRGSSEQAVVAVE